MASLTAHLRGPEDHARLAFHSQCPLCRSQRLSGPLPIEPLVSRRMQAGVTAAVLALTSVSPTAALATQDDQEFEGGAATEEVTAATGEIDIGVAANDLDQDAGVAPAEAGADEESADPAAPGASVPVAVPKPAAIAPGSPQTAAEADPAPVLAPAAVPSETAAAADTETATETGTKTNRKRPQARFERTEPTRHRVPARHRAAPRRVVAPSASSAPSTGSAGSAPSAASAPVAAAPTAPVPAAAAPTAPARLTASVEAAAVSGRAARRGDDSHVVLRGESLWSIAGDLVGEDASPARIAREVNRLWQLNHDRIGTGDRDLLMAGTKLVLR